MYVNSELFQVDDGKLIQTLHDIYSTFSPDWKLIASCDGETVKIAHVSDGKLIQTLPGGYDCHLYPPLFSPDGKIVATWDKNVELFQVSDGKLIQSFPGEEIVQFSPDGNFIITSGGRDSSSLKVWRRQVISKKDFDQQERFVKAFAAIMDREDRERTAQYRDAMVAKQHLREERKRKGLCIVCGAKLSFWDKLRGWTTCPDHS